MDVREVLENIGYKLAHDGSNYYRAKPLYRDSGNATALRISKKNGNFVDFAAQIRGNLVDLVKMTLGLKSLSEAKSWLDTQQFAFGSMSVDEKPIIEQSIKYYNESLLDRLVVNHAYWLNRGVSEKTLKKYRGGVAVSGHSVLYNRYVFPVFTEDGRIIGFAGRDISNKSPIKWKLVGSKTDWVFPAHNIPNIREKQEVILVESIGDHLALEEAGIHNSLVIFGVFMGDNLLSRLNSLMPKKIIIALNNDRDKGNVGQNCAKTIEGRLLQFFDRKAVQINLPTNANDFGEMSVAAIQEWYKQTK